VIDMTDDALEQFLAEDPGGPVVMLNLLRYIPGTGRADYLAYIAHTPTISGRYGTEPLYWGDGGCVSFPQRRGLDVGVLTERPAAALAGALRRRRRVRLPGDPATVLRPPRAGDP
jgi:hypothetical protein